MNPESIRLFDNDKYVNGLASYIRSLTTDPHLHGGLVMIEGLLLLDPDRASEIIGAILAGFSVFKIKNTGHARLFRDELNIALAHINSTIIPPE